MGEELLGDSLPQPLDSALEHLLDEQRGDRRVGLAGVLRKNLPQTSAIDDKSSITSSSGTYLVHDFHGLLAAHLVPHAVAGDDQVCLRKVGNVLNLALELQPHVHEGGAVVPAAVRREDTKSEMPDRIFLSLFVQLRRQRVVVVRT